MARARKHFDVFKRAIRLPFRLVGIPIQLDISFLVFLPILSWMIGTQVENLAEVLDLSVDVTPLTEGSRPFLIGLAAGVGLFLSILIHEIGHAVVGLKYGAVIRSITLWLLGGMAQFEDFPRQKGAEAVIAIAGPITSFLLGGVCWLLLLVTPEESATGVFLLSYLLYMNWFVAVFNLVPALPLDGGRVLRSLLALSMSYLKATRISTGVSRFIAFLLGFLGFVNGNILLVLVAFFVYAAGSGESAMVTIREGLRGLKVRDLMSRDLEVVYSHLLVSDLLDRMLRDRYLGYPVVDLSGDLVGIVSIDDVKGSHDPKDAAQEMRVSDVMRSPAPTLLESADALEGFELINEEHGDRLVVLDSAGERVGIISRTDLVRAVQVKMIGMPWRTAAPSADEP